MRALKGLLCLFPLAIIVAAIFVSSHYVPSVLEVIKMIYLVFSGIIFTLLALIVILIATFFARVGVLYLFKINVGFKTPKTGVHSKDDGNSNR